jgi:mRNA-degrading endonuclease RelE of RelBE toxin-antitoxin system
MAYQVKITAHASKSAQKLNPEVKKAAKAALKELAQNPYHGKELQAELSGFFSYKFLRYRIVYKPDTAEKIIVVWGIGHRRDIYESLGEHLLNETGK